MPKETTRKCIVCGEIKEKEQLLRFAVLPNGQVVPDFKKKLSGRGVYVSVSRSALQKAVAGNFFARTLKIKAKAGAELVEQTEILLRRQALDAVSLARKAGALVCGMDKVLDALKKRKVAFLLEASDAGEDGHRKILEHPDGRKYPSIRAIAKSLGLSEATLWRELNRGCAGWTYCMLLKDK